MIRHIRKLWVYSQNRPAPHLAILPCHFTWYSCSSSMNAYEAYEIVRVQLIEICKELITNCNQMPLNNTMWKRIQSVINVPLQTMYHLVKNTLHTFTRISFRCMCRKYVYMVGWCEIHWCAKWPNHYIPNTLRNERQHLNVMDLANKNLAAVTWCGLSV